MSYQVLARKWRPQTFDAVVGQEPITRTLRNALATGRIAHAYLFAGPRGVGKTTTARLLAKALLCGARTGPEPCGACPACQELVAGTLVDVIEIDGASNRGIDEIRTLRENVRYAPVRGRYKVYIIDEVHQLTDAAFNALLKTLEEPPAHVVFVLATTQPQEMPLTVLSRCQRFDFKPIAPELLRTSLEQILRAEKMEFDPSALPLLVRSAEGSLRDALSLLDTALAYGDGRLDAESLAHLLGASTPAQVRAFVQALLARDGAVALGAIDRAARGGEDLVFLCREAIEGVRRSLLLKLAPHLCPPDLTAAEGDAFRAQGAEVSVEELLYLLKVFVEAEGELRRSPHPRVELEIAAVKATRRPVVVAIESVLARVEEAEERLRRMAVVGGVAPTPASAPVQESLIPLEAGARSQSPPASRITPSPPPRPATNSPGRSLAPGAGPAATLGQGLEAEWRQVVDEVMQRKPSLGAVLDQSTPVALAEGTLTVAVVGNHFHKDLLADRANHDLVTQSVRRHIPGAIRFEISVGTGQVAGAQGHPAVQAALGVFQGDVVAVRPRTQEGGEGQ
ncbi:MAG: DNA polymerase III subunit gamma/tau [Candidatus Rokubacteria bacterium]|nr:DNA polymerase III subunit gamma/tau [Candidatus Rokubacteria bacterium]